MEVVSRRQPQRPYDRPAGLGELSLAHNGVRFLDELPKFLRNVLDLLRQPIKEGGVTLARSQMTLAFPARFMLVAAMNPCQWGH